MWPFQITFYFIFACNFIKINCSVFRYFSNSVLHTFPTLAPNGYDVIPSKFCNLLSPLLLNALLLTFLVNTFCVSLLNLCCNLNII